MDGFLVFDVANDLIFKFMNDPMKDKLQKLVDDMKLIRVSLHSMFLCKKNIFYLSINICYLTLVLFPI